MHFPPSYSGYTRLKYFKPLLAPFHVLSIATFGLCFPGEKLVSVAIWNPMPERIKKKGGGWKEIDKTRKGGEEMKEMKQKKDRDEVRSILADSSRDRRTLVLLFVPYFSPWLKLPLSLSLSLSLPHLHFLLPLSLFTLPTRFPQHLFPWGNLQP